jgi:hypothetical protein
VTRIADNVIGSQISETGNGGSSCNTGKFSKLGTTGAKIDLAVRAHRKPILVDFSSDPPHPRPRAFVRSLPDLVIQHAAGNSVIITDTAQKSQGRQIPCVQQPVLFGDRRGQAA